jgi:hypothetical protein
MRYEVGDVIRFQPEPSTCWLTGTIIVRAVVGDDPPVYTVRTSGPAGRSYTVMGDGAITLTGESFNLARHMQRHIEFSERTFGPGDRTSGVVDHIRKELVEIEDAKAVGEPTLPEWVDVILLGLDGAWRSGASPEEIIEALQMKQTKNEGRRWPDWRTADTGKAIEHDRSGEQAASPSLSDVVAWAVSQWKDEVANRPLENVHRRTLDDAWRRMIRFGGGDPVALLGPAHDDLAAVQTTKAEARRREAFDSPPDDFEVNVRANRPDTAR